MTVRDRRRLASAYTIRTRLPACRHSGNDAHKRGGDGNSGDGGDSSDDDGGGGGDVIEPRRSMQTGKLKLSQP